MPTPINFLSPLDSDLILESVNMTSGLSKLGETHVTLLSESGDLIPEDLLGKPVTIKIELRDGSFRYIHSHVARFGLGKQRGRYFGYQATLRPWLWFLTRTSDCRIFQDKTVPEIVKAVFEDHGIANYLPNLFRTYRKRDYCVQYRESDFNFIARLLEQEGIYWYFDHTESEHKLMLVDSMSQHDPVENYEELPFYDTVDQVPPDTDYVSNWSFTREVKSGTFVLKDFDFTKPTQKLEAQADLARQYSLATEEVFDYPGNFLKSADGAQYAENLLDEAQTGFQVVKGTTTAQGLAAGFLMTLTKHPRDDQNAQFLLTHVDLQFQMDGDEGGSGHDGSFNCQFVGIPFTQQFRPQRVTRRPFVQGPQTATVTGPSGEEIHTDEYGRVKVKFHWDRSKVKDDTSSCWIRVAQIWAGSNFGGIFLPRVDQEVIVDFLEGDPDQPIITGRVYNRDNMPPWNLPENKTQSGLLTRSSQKGGYGDANAIRFEDKKGSEELWIQAQKDMTSTVENDKTEMVLHDRTRTVKNHEKIIIGKGREVTIEKDGEIVQITGKRTYKLTGAEEETVTDGRKINITGTYEEYDTGTRKMWTSGEFVFKSTGAYFDAGPEYYLKGTALKFKGTAINIESSADTNVKAANFKFAASGNYDFIGNKFNRTIFEGNDTVLGANTNTYIGSSRDTAMGPSVQAYLGMANSAAAGISVESFLGMQVTNVVALSMANETLTIGNTGIAMGMTGVDLGVCGVSIENNAIKLLNGGGASGAGAGSMLSGAGAAAMMAAAVGGGFALGFGAAAAFDAIKQAKADIKALVNTEGLTPETKARLQRFVDNPFSTATHHQTAENYSATIPQSQIDAQLDAFINPPPAKDAPPVPPQHDPTADLGPPPADAP